MNHSISIIHAGKVMGFEQTRTFKCKAATRYIEARILIEASAGKDMVMIPLQEDILKNMTIDIDMSDEIVEMLHEQGYSAFREMNANRPYLYISWEERRY